MHKVSRTISAIVGAVLLVAASLPIEPQSIAHAAGGTISGVVRNAQGAPIPNATVRAMIDQTHWVMLPVTVTADANGAFSISGLVPTQYRIGASATGYAARYANANRWEQATTFDVTADSTLTTDITLYQPTATISGRILDDLGAPVVGASVSVGMEWPMGMYPHTNLDHFGRTVLTGADGRYSATGLAPGAYSLQATPPTTSLIGGRYPGGTGLGTPFAVAPGATVTGIDLVLPHSGTVTGRITSPSGAPIAGAWVSTEWWDFPIQTTTAADGTFTLTGVAPGTHTVWADALAGPYMTTFYGQTIRGIAATTFDVTAGGTVGGIDLELIEGVEVLVRTLDTAGHGSMSPHVYGCLFPGALSPNLLTPSPQLDCTNSAFAGQGVSGGTDGTVIRFAPGDYNVAAVLGDRTMTDTASLRVVLGDTPTCTLRMNGTSHCSSSVPPPPVVTPPVVTPPVVTPPAATPPALVCPTSANGLSSASVTVANIDSDAATPACPYAVAVRIRAVAP